MKYRFSTNLKTPKQAEIFLDGLNPALLKNMNLNNCVNSIKRFKRLMENEE